jgi:hypothetical protein
LALFGRLARVQHVDEEVRGAVQRVVESLDAAGPDVVSPDAIRTAARDLLAALGEAASREEVNRYRRSVAGMEDSFDAPTEGQTLDLARLGDALDHLETRMRGFLAVDLVRFRDQVSDAGLELVPVPALPGG